MNLDDIDQPRKERQLNDYLFFQNLGRAILLAIIICGLIGIAKAAQAHNSQGHKYIAYMEAFQHDVLPDGFAIYDNPQSLYDNHCLEHNPRAGWHSRFFIINARSKAMQSLQLPRCVDITLQKPKPKKKEVKLGLPPEQSKDDSVGSDCGDDQSCAGSREDPAEDKEVQEPVPSDSSAGSAESDPVRH